MFDLHPSGPDATRSHRLRPLVTLALALLTLTSACGADEQVVSSDTPDTERRSTTTERRSTTTEPRSTTTERRTTTTERRTTTTERRTTTTERRTTTTERRTTTTERRTTTTAVTIPPLNGCGGYAPVDWGPGSYGVEWWLEGTFDGQQTCLGIRREVRCRLALCVKDDVEFALFTPIACVRGEVEMIGNDGALFEPEIPISSGYGDELFASRFDCQSRTQLPGIGPESYLVLLPGGGAQMTIGPFTDLPWVGLFS